MTEAVKHAYVADPFDLQPYPPCGVCGEQPNDWQHREND